MARFDRFRVRHPAFVVAVGMVAVVTAEAHLPGAGWAVGLGFALLLWRLTRSLKFSCAAALIAVIMLANVMRHDARMASAGAWIEQGNIATVEARLVEDATGKNGRWRAPAKLHATPIRGSKVMWLGTGEPPPQGTELKAHGRFYPFQPERNPGVPDLRERTEIAGIVGLFHASEMRSRQWTGPLSRKRAAFKRAFRESITAGLEQDSTAARVIRAVVLGEKSPDSLGLIRVFRESGTLHVFTVSGLHVAMVGGMIWALLRLLRCPKRRAIPVIILSMFGYVWLTGSGPAAVRAAWMGAVFLGAFLLRRRPDLLNSLGFVLLAAMLWNPGIIRLPGVQLSYGVVAAIGLGTALARRCFLWIAEEEELLPRSELSWPQAKWLRFREKLAESFSVSLAAAVGSSPLSAVHFGIIAPVSVIATVFLVGQVFILLAVALVSAGMNPLWTSGSEFLNRRNATVARLCAATAGGFSKIPGAWANTRSPDEDTLVIYDLKYGAEAACFATDSGNAVLLDSGGRYNLKWPVGVSLNRLGMRPDSLLVTHADAGHVAPAGLTREMFPIRQVVLGPDRTSGSVAATWEREPGIRPLRPAAGTFLEFGNEVRAEILLSPHDRAPGSRADDRCMVFMLHWHGWKLLWLGDAGRLSEQLLLETFPDLKADLLVAGLHQSDYSLTPGFLEALSPQAVILPRLSGSEMDSHRTARKKSLEKSPLKVIDRRETGGLTITLEPGGREMRVRGFLDQSETTLNK